ncbi:LOW QUALITY PROTEIN: macrophage colony-stimulating factor 1 receptor 2 [Phycodurus eques]|uniref:LOW QUALITY PROTEIN: macrophage colony-stimulating factor 1 receptor 2 n=1 Tax=Phycodurus eques TaxID=693459 RepID=UPI002ACEAF52|nr:LOW QUALITY PROTEIN: macrophage colony-stimulating factor 1 receptor 2 [Phycodurus eques]
MKTMKMEMALLLFLLSIVSAEDFSPPFIRLNSDLLQNRSEAVLTAGSAFILSCHGNASLHWSSTAFRSASKVRGGVLEVRRARPRHTGTYRCAYADRSLEHLHASVHLYIKDPLDPTSVFVTPHFTPGVREGDDLLFRCLLTDPSVTNLTLLSEEDRAGLPPGMNVSADPRRGVVVRKADRRFNGRYVCAAWNNETRVTSDTLHLIVTPRQRRPPEASVDQTDFFRVAGETFAVTCMTGNPSLIYSVSWTHPDVEAPNVTLTRHYTSNRSSMNSTLIVASVSGKHSGRYTCTARNEAGDATAAARLRVLDAPFLTACLQRRTSAQSGANVSASGVEPCGGLHANASDWEVLVNVSVDTMEANRVSSSSGVDVLEGGDVMLTVAVEAYPPIRSLEWTTPTSGNDSAAPAQSYAANGYRSQASLLLRRVRDGEKGRYALRYANALFSGSFNFDLRVLRSPSGVITVENDTLTCSGSGFPPPTLRWSRCSGLVDTCGDVSVDRLDEVTTREGEGLKKHLALPQAPDEDITIECVSINSVGRSRDVFFLRSVGSGGGRVLTAPLAAASIGATLLLLLVIFLIFRIRRRPKYEIRWKIVESCYGNNYTFVDPSLLPYNNLKWEFPRDKLRLGGVLGSGAFGKVVEATAYGLGSRDETRVAVKMLKPSAHSEEREALMCELKILSHLGYHDNIVNLLGACTRGGPVLMITEYCFHGDLLNFLREHAHRLVAAMLSTGPAEHEAKYSNVRLRSDSGISCCSEYQEMQPMLSHSGVQRSARLCVSDLMRFSYQVAQGLDFLSTQNCIHRDVAARNVLLTDRHVAKICDFGLARDIRNDDSYIVQGNARLPVKWMSPESIFQCVYTVQSDVWSYGVLLWEIFSLGKSPYPNVAVDTKFYKMIQDGRHMERPDFAPPQMYQLMTSCWSLEPTDRPTFKTIGQLIERILPSANKAAPGEQPTYKNIDERGEDEESEEEEGRGGDSLKAEEQDGGQEREESIKMTQMTNNIYQLS